MGIKSKLFKVNDKQSSYLMMAISEQDAINSFKSSMFVNGKVVAAFISDIEVFGGLSATNLLQHPVYALPSDEYVKNDAAISEELFALLPMYA
jgi:hypothetical protein